MYVILLKIFSKTYVSATQFQFEKNNLKFEKEIIKQIDIPQVSTYKSFLFTAEKNSGTFKLFTIQFRNYLQMEKNIITVSKYYY